MLQSEEEQRYQALFEGAPIGIWEEDFSGVRSCLAEIQRSGIPDLRRHLAAHPEAVLDCVKRVRVLSVNRQARAFYGASTKEELIGRLPELFDERSLEIFREEILALWEGSSSYESEVWARTLDGEERLVQMNVSQLPSNEPWSRVIVAFTDLSERRRLEDSLQRTNESLLRANRDLEQFAYGAAHDLREPIRTTALYAQLLKRLDIQSLGKPAAMALEFILNGTAKMDTLVADLLSFARSVDPPDMDSTLFADADWEIREVIGTLAHAAERAGVRIEHARLPRVAMEPAHLRQLFQNLIGNAIKYRTAEREPVVRISVQEDHSYVTFCVADNGIGIKPEYHDRIFGIFKRLHGQEIEGNGIGLALCRRIVEKYGGSIWVESEAGQGCRFYFRAPALTEQDSGLLRRRTQQEMGEEQ